MWGGAIAAYRSQRQRVKKAESLGGEKGDEESLFFCAVNWVK